MTVSKPIRRPAPPCLLAARNSGTSRGPLRERIPVKVLAAISIGCKVLYTLRKHRYHWFSREMMSEERAQKFHTDDVSLLGSG